MLSCVPNLSQSNLNHCQQVGPYVSTQWTTLPSGNASFQYACDKTSDVLLNQGGGKMLSSIVNPNTGQLQATPFSVGAGIDSYYEYLLKQWLQSTKTENKWVMCMCVYIQAITSLNDLHVYLHCT